MSKLEVDKIDPQSGTDLELGTSGDTITIPAGVTFDSSAATNTLPSTVVTTTGTQTLTNKNIVASQLTGTITPSDSTVTLAKLTATGTQDATTFLRGDNTFAAVTSPAIVKLQTQTASSSSTITFTSTYLTATYKKYYLDYTNVVISSDGGNISATVSADNGSSYTTSGYNYWRIISGTGTSNNTIASGGDTNNGSLLMLGTGNGLGTAADESGSGRMTIFDPFSADSKFFICDGLLIGSDGVLTQQNIYQALKTSTTINNIKISPNTGTIVSGTFTLYGVTT
jgi:hypothetical protein